MLTYPREVADDVAQMGEGRGVAVVTEGVAVVGPRLLLLLWI